MIRYESDRSNINNYFYRQTDENLTFPAHIHDSFEFLYCFEGEILLSADAKEYLRAVFARKRFLTKFFIGNGENFRQNFSFYA